MQASRPPRLRARPGRPRLDYDAVIEAMRNAYRQAVMHFKDRAKAAERERDEARAALAEAKAEIKRLTDSPWREAWRIFDIVTAPSDADLEALYQDTLLDEAALRAVLKAIVDRARAPEREGDEK